VIQLQETTRKFAVKYHESFKLIETHVVRILSTDFFVRPGIEQIKKAQNLCAPLKKLICIESR